MTSHLFVDESKERGFLLAAAIVAPEEVARLRGQVSALRLPGQRRLHFASERDSRRACIVRTFTEAGVRAVLYDARGHTDGKRARDTAVSRLAADAAKMGAARLILERDDSVVEADRRIIREQLLEAGCHDTLVYEHLRAHEEHLLALPDAICWCYARGGQWRGRVMTMVAEVITV